MPTYSALFQHPPTEPDVSVSVSSRLASGQYRSQKSAIDCQFQYGYLHLAYLVATDNLTTYPALPCERLSRSPWWGDYTAFSITPLLIPRLLPGLRHLGTLVL